MYIHPFVAGVLCTIFAGLVVFIIAATVSSNKNKDK